MTKDKYPLYALAIVGVGAVALWAGLPPALLIILLICPLIMFAMMFFMMRGMHGGTENHDAPNSHSETGSHGFDVRSASGAPGHRAPDGSHERIDQPE